MQGSPLYEGTMHFTRHWDITVEMFTFALATFLLFTVALCTVTLLGMNKGPFTPKAFSDLWPDHDGSQPNFRTWMKTPFFVFFFTCVA